jgi:hypothetical protein
LADWILLKRNPLWFLMSLSIVSNISIIMNNMELQP